MWSARTFAACAAVALGTTLSTAPHAAWALGSTPVTVTNPVTVANPDDPKAFAKAQGIQHPFQIELTCSQTPGGCPANFELSAVAPNQRLILEYVSGQCVLLPTDTVVQVGVQAVVGNTTVFHSVSVTDRITVGSEVIDNFAGPVRIYADANSFIDVLAVTTGTSSGSCRFSLAGQTVDVP